MVLLYAIQRWFVLKGNLLFYYEKKDEKDPIGVIILEGCTVELSEMNDTNTFTFELVFQGTKEFKYKLNTVITDTKVVI